MKTRILTSRLSLVIILMVLSTFACNLFGAGDNPDDETVSSETTPGGVSSQDEKDTSTPTLEPAQPDFLLSDEPYRSAEGGFSFNAIEGYQLEDFFGFITLLAPGGDPDTGPGIFMIGEVAGEMTLDEYFDNQTAGMETDGVVLSSYKDIFLDGYHGRSVDITGVTDEGDPVSGRMTFVLVSPTHHFSMMGQSLTDQWDDLSPLYDAVLDTVTFFKPEGDMEISGQDESGGGGEAMKEEIRQWASDAFASSEYSNPEYAAIQATGEPDTFIQECADLPTAWASLGTDTVDWIELAYEIPVIPTELNIIQTHSPDQVVLVELVDLNGSYYQVYSAEPLDKWELCPYTLSIPLDLDFEVAGVKITIDQSVIPTPWNEIDAVELVGIATVGGDAAQDTADDTSTAEVSSEVQLDLPQISVEGISTGGFYYEVVGANEDTVVEDGTLQYQSTSEEYVIGFVSSNFRYAVSLFLPIDVKPGVYPLKLYPRNEFVKNPTAAIYIGAGYYYADGGQVKITDVSNGTVSGIFIFKATYESDPNRVVEVQGAFNQVPLQ